MAHFVTSQDIPRDGEHLPARRVGLLGLICGAIGGLGLIGSFLYLAFGSGEAHGSFAFSWLYGLFFFLTIAFGGLFWTLLHNLSNSGWGTSVRRLMENLAFVLPFLFLFSLPLLLPSVKPYLWEWMTSFAEAKKAHPDLAISKALLESANPHDHLLAKKTFYLSPFWWHLRFVAYIVVAAFLTWKLRRLSVDQDQDPTPGTQRLFAARAWSAPGMFLFGVSFTFLAIDWVMGLDYSWFSTMWGVYIFAGSALSSMAVLLLTVIWLQGAGYLKKVVTPEHHHIMGKLILAFTIFWAYVSFSQFFLYWYANIPEETRYFLLRNTGEWNLVSLILVFGHFGLPFLLLLRADLKRKPAFMVLMCVYLLVLHALDVYHQIIPERGPSVGLVVHHEARLWIGGVSSFLTDLLALLIVGCGFLFFYLRNLSSAALYPHRDPRILESANLSN